MLSKICGATVSFHKFHLLPNPSATSSLCQTNANPFLPDDDARVATTKVLTKWRPHVLLSEDKKLIDTNGIIKQEQDQDPNVASNPSTSTPTPNPTTGESKQTQAAAAIITAVG